jgi:uncharacterized protein DUF4386
VTATTRARITGAVYLLFFVTAVASGVLAPGVTGPGSLGGNAAAVANSIEAHRSTYELGVALSLVSTAFYVALAGLFYRMFRPVGKTPALLAALFSLVGCAVTAFGGVLQLAPMAVLSGESYLNAFTTEQLQAMALIFLNLNALAGHVALVFFGAFQLFLGYLIWRSAFLPRLLGALIAIAGVGWLTFLSSAASTPLLVPVEVLGFVAEAALMLWLLVMGVNEQRWQDLAAVAG